ncbi:MULTISPECIES: MarR family winged helix-turn-helix transcriptional regulator [unclassified Brevundimonas]|uniref:MarR family winged helix-turn-helix transcriptional regulator n=1 Tax=unclassified Brevundimonas TaxID=2622653 RepID=UPI0025B9673D|nr:MULTISPECIES: MarR family transcriptional regulator [unclassified Brevundimonas]
MIKTAIQKGPVAELAQSPSHLMHRALQLCLDIYAEEAVEAGLTQRQYAVLEVASQKQGLTQTDLVKATGIDRSTLADLVSRMITKGYLERERSAVDARAKAVRVSQAGLAALEAARPCVQAADKRLLAMLPKARRQNFIEILQHLSDVADAAPEEIKAAKKAAKKADKEARKAAKLLKKSKKDDEASGRTKSRKA